MSYLGWVISFCLMVLGMLFFSVNTIALRTLSRGKLFEMLKSAGKEKLAGQIIKNCEKLTLTCALCRFILNICILFFLVVVFANYRQAPLESTDYIIIFIVSLAIFSVLGLAIPHAWAKYQGEKILAYTYKVLAFLQLLSGLFCIYSACMISWCADLRG